MNQVPLIWLTGNNMPDHNTLWRFYRDNKKAVRSLFKQSVKLGLNAGLVEMMLHAVDGTMIKARGSKRKVIGRDDIDRILDKLDESIEIADSEIEKNESEESGEYRLPRELSDREKLRERLLKAREKMDEIDRKCLHPDEDEARMMLCSGQIDLAYNAQAVADEKSGLIVAEDVVNEENDRHQLTSMIDEVSDNTGDSADETLADGGYYSSAELVKAEESGYSVLVNLKSEYDDEFHWSKFIFDEENDCFICPLQKRLEFSSVDRSENIPARVYQCKCYKECPRRWDCSTAQQGRRVKIGMFHKAMTRQKKKQHDNDKRLLLKKRKAIIEMVFGIIKECMGFRRWTVGGLENVKTQWAMICTAFNLKKLYKHWRDGRLVLQAV